MLSFSKSTRVLALRQSNLFACYFSRHCTESANESMEHNRVLDDITWKALRHNSELNEMVVNLKRQLNQSYTKKEMEEIAYFSALRHTDYESFSEALGAGYHSGLLTKKVVAFFHAQFMEGKSRPYGDSDQYDSSHFQMPKKIKCNGIVPLVTHCRRRIMEGEEVEPHPSTAVLHEFESAESYVNTFMGYWSDEKYCDKLRETVEKRKKVKWRIIVGNSIYESTYRHGLRGLKALNKLANCQVKVAAGTGWCGKGHWKYGDKDGKCYYIGSWQPTLAATTDNEEIGALIYVSEPVKVWTDEFNAIWVNADDKELMV